MRCQPTRRLFGQCKAGEREIGEELDARKQKVPKQILGTKSQPGIAPTENVLAIRPNPETGERTLDALRSGLIPNWAKDEKIADKTISART